MRTGAARGAANVVYLMMSSGIGGGLVLDGSLFTGHSGMTGELGHVPVDPGGAAVPVREPRLPGDGGRRPPAARAAAPATRRRVTLADAAARARAGDALCARLFQEAGTAAGRVAGGICNLVNPELVIVGGDMIVAGDLLVDAVAAGLAETAIAAVRRDVTVVAATLGDRAELLGAIGLAIAEADVAVVTGTAEARVA